MAQVGTLGDIVFKVSEKTVQTFDGLQIESKTNYAKHTRHNKKPLLEFQYNDTDTASLNCCNQYPSKQLRNFICTL